MTPEEFSNEFDSLLQTHLLKQGFGNTDIRSFDEYEKSVFLTKAQEEIVKEIYSGKNPYGEGFENTEEVRRYLAPLVFTKIIVDKLKEDIGLSSNSIFYRLPDDVWFITYESVKLNGEDSGCNNGKEILVTPITQDEYYRIMENPFRGPSVRRALRLDIEGNIVEIITPYSIEGYKVRYLSKPKPIILEELPDNLSINNETSISGCELNPAIHRLILERAVRLALVSKAQINRS